MIIRKLKRLMGGFKAPVEPMEPSNKLDIRSGYWASKFIGEKGLAIHEADDGFYELNFKGFTFTFSSDEDLFIINEVFEEYCYGLVLPEKHEYILFDIGMNIGVASTYFSTIPQVKCIYGFEPFLPTYNLLMKNLLRNNLLEKCIAQNIGLGRESREETWSYSNEFKGSSGKSELNIDKKLLSRELLELPVKIADAAFEFKRIIESHPNERFIVKMDCEGGEYEIVARLKEEGILCKISIFLIEWHNEATPSLLKEFTGFTCFFHKLSNDTGIIYAINKQ
jgi:FkbM family methyltransferase